jgi:plasmid replication initiation protein
LLYAHEIFETMGAIKLADTGTYLLLVNTKTNNPHQLVVVGNPLVKVRTSFSLSLNAIRLLRACFSKVDSRAEYDKDKVLKVPISLTEDWIPIYGGSVSTLYRDLKRTLDEIWKNELVITYPDERGRVENLRWIYKKTERPTAGTVTLFFSPDIAEQLLGQYGNFTRYYLAWAAQLSSSSAWRLYELLCQWDTTKHVKITLDDLRELLVEEHQYAETKEFNQKVLKPAIKQINAKTNMRVEMTPVRVGRAIHAYEFNFTVDSEKSPPAKDMRRQPPRKPYKEEQQELHLELVLPAAAQDPTKPETRGFMEKHTDTAWREGLLD